jgi:dihydrodipicolinate synthase/N-acetylneuraminate lyase
VLAGVGSATLDSSIALARGARDAGAAAVLLPPPYFFRYQQDDLREFYCQFAAHTGPGAAIWIVNTPACTSNIEIPTALELLSTGHYAGFVDGSGSTDSLLKVKASARCETLAGSDAVFTQSRFAGACGGVSEAACAAPELMVALNRAIAAGNRREAESLDARLQEFVGWMNQFPQPVIVKFATGLRGLKTGPLPMPLCGEKQRKLDEFREWFQGWLPAVRKLTASA